MRQPIKASTTCAVCGKDFTPAERAGGLYIYSTHTGNYFHLDGREGCARPTTPEPERDNRVVTKGEFKTIRRSTPRKR